MATITEDKKVFMETALDTFFDAICVKRRGKPLQELFEMDYSHGKLVQPAIHQGPTAMLELKETMMRSFHPVVIVRGHGWGMPHDRFVWTGTSDEFNETWEID